MIISSKGRYALRVMTDLAEHADQGFISLADISARQEISLKYLEAITALLNKAGLLDSLRGKSGGYKLKKKPEDYTLREILEVTEGGIVPVNCACLTGDEECKRSALCPTMPVWQRLDRIISDYLESVTLKDLITESL
ncbi:MAG: RrF2 family transcriptional regulator [Acutalibacteraceae bacterium]